MAMTGAQGAEEASSAMDEMSNTGKEVGDTMNSAKKKLSQCIIFYQYGLLITSDLKHKCDKKHSQKKESPNRQGKVLFKQY